MAPAVPIKKVLIVRKPGAWGGYRVCTQTERGAIRTAAEVVYRDEAECIARALRRQHKLEA
jgi:hypothetical protein